MLRSRVRSAFALRTTLGVEDPHLHFIVNDGYMVKARHTEQRLQERRRDTTRNTRAPAEWMGGDRRHRDLQLMVQHCPDLLNFSSHVLQPSELALLFGSYFTRFCLVFFFYSLYIQSIQLLVW